MKRIVIPLMLGIAGLSATARAEESGDLATKLLEYRFSGDAKGVRNLEKSLGASKLRVLKPGPDVAEKDWDCIRYNSTAKDRQRYVCVAEASAEMAKAYSQVAVPKFRMQVAALSDDCTAVACTYTPTETPNKPCKFYGGTGGYYGCYHLRYGENGREREPDADHVCDY